jgi:uncharacterized protein YbjT (DUF2867 family)
MRIAIAGGTGVAGRYAVEAARRAGHETVVLSRRNGIDLTTGAGLAPALEGVNVIIDATNTRTQDRAKATNFFTAVAAQLQRAGHQQGVAGLVVLSIVGLERVPSGYFQAKLAHEAAALDGPLDVRVVRATQFHEFPGQIVRRARFGPVALAPRMVVQPIAARTVGEILVEVAASADASPRLEIAGPAKEYLPDLAQAIVHRQGKRVVVLPFSVPGKGGAAMRSGGQLPVGDVRVAGPTFTEWLEGDDPLNIAP